MFKGVNNFPGRAKFRLIKAHGPQRLSPSEN
jgi:hypothetical protein